MNMDFERLLLEKMNTAILLVSRTMEILYANGAAHKFFDRQDSMAGLFVDEVAGENGLTFQQLASDALGDGGEALPHEAILLTPDGEFRTLLMSALRIGEDIAVIFTDLTDLRALQRQRERAARMLFLEKFAGGVADEMTGPLSVLKVCANGDPNRIRNMDNPLLLREVVRRETSRLSELLKRLEKFANPGVPRPQPVNVNELVADVISYISNESVNGQIPIHFEPDDQVPLALLDPEQGRRALSEILAFMTAVAAECIEPSVLIKVCECPAIQGIASNSVEILIRGNTGECEEIYPADLFNPIIHGTHGGADLAFVKQFVISHGGQIEVLHEDGIGTTFSLLFPAHQVNVE